MMTFPLLLRSGLALALDLSDDGRIEAAWWSWRGLTFAEVLVGRA